MEAIKTFFESIEKNGTLITILICIAVALGAFILIRSVHALLSRLAARGRFDVAAVNLMRRTADTLIVSLAVIILFMQIETLHRIAVSLLATTGVLAVVVGLAAQQAMSNVVSGVFIALFKPFSIGDRIRVLEKNILGTVEDITMRHTVIRTFENNRIIVPNSTMSGAIIENARYQDEKVCQFFDVGISFDADIDRAMAVLADAVRSHPLFYDNRTEAEKAAGAPDVVVRMTGFGDGAIHLRALVWARNAAEGYTMVCDLNRIIVWRFREEGIQIPVTYRTAVAR